VLNENMSQPASVELHIQHTLVKATIDSGSSVTLITKQTLDKIRRATKEPIKVRPTRVTVTGLDHELHLHGEVKLLLELGATHLVRFLVVENLPHDALIGNDVLDVLRARIKMGDGVLKVGGKRINVRTQERYPHAVVLRAKEATVVKARTTTMVPATGNVAALFSANTKPEGKEVIISEQGAIHGQGGGGRQGTPRGAATLPGRADELGAVEQPRARHERLH